MLLLGFHIVSISMLVLVVWIIAYRMGFREGARRAARAIEESRNVS